MFVVHFLLLLVPLVLFHELGHFLVARWMGVRVLSFSIGFGPVVAAWTKDGTEYAIRALPLGGFVRMLGDDPTGGDDDGPPPPDSFAAKPVWRRSLIVAAGPIANLLLPIAILFGGSMISDGQVVSSRIGTVLPGGPADQAGLRSGDRVLSIDDEPTPTFMDLRRVVTARPGKRVTAVVERDGKKETLWLEPEARRDMRLPEIGVIDTVGRIQVLPDGQAAIVQVRPDGPAFAAGLRSGERIIEVDGKATRRSWELQAALIAAKGRDVTLRVAPPRHDAPLDEAAIKAHDGELHDLAAARDVRLRAASMMDLGLEPAQRVVGYLEADSPAVSAGLRVGDEVLAIDGDPVGSFLTVHERLRKRFDDARADDAARGLEGDELLAHIRAGLGDPYTLTIRRADGGAARELQVPLTVAVVLDATGRPKLRFGAGPMQRYEAPELIDNPAPLVYAAHQTADEMQEALRVTLLTVAGLFRGHVPVKEVGGPIFMAQLASRTADLGWGYFFKLMVWLSVNLAILNLLPIPIADGGHLFFLAIEAVRREPVSLRTRMVAAYVGMTFLGLLFVVVMKNDVQRLIATFAN